MTAHYEDGPVQVWHGDCIDVMRELPDASVDAVVTDPPYALEFMGHGWDRYTPGEFQHWCEEWAAEAYRLLKPGGHLLAFGGTRTFHRLTAGIEDAGFEIRDSIAWLYGSGFPKSMNVAKAIESGSGRPEDIRRLAMGDEYAPSGRGRVSASAMNGATEPVQLSENAARWQGWGTALKPAFEPIVVARKPLQGTVAANVLQWGTGALNIDGSRIQHRSEADRAESVNKNRHADFGTEPGGNAVYGDFSMVPSRNYDGSAGRWPANVVLDASQAAALDQQSGPAGSNSTASGSTGDGMFGTRVGGATHDTRDAGGASRFFKTVDTVTPRFMYTAKAGSDERPKVEREGAGNGRVTGLGGKVRQCNVCGTRAIESGAGSPSCGHDDYFWAEPTTSTADTVSHPTVKPVALMRWLVKLVTPPGGVVLEPFAGSGTTVEAAVLEGFHCIAIEREGDYLPLILQRIRKPHAVGLDFGEWEA